MRTRALFGIALLAVLASAAPTWARGGGGCFLPDTPITKADGTTVPISEIQVGDQLLAFEPDGRIVTAAVRNIITHEVAGYLVVTTDSAVVRATAEHPFLVGEATFATLGSLNVGDTVYSLDGGKLTPQRIISIQPIAEPTTVYNLQTDEPHTFFAAGLAVHNKGGGGCFLGDTPVTRADGTTVAISDVKAGDQLLACEPGGRIVTAAVQSVITHDAPDYLVVTTDVAVVRATAEHPFFVGDGTFRTLGSLKVGDRVYGLDGGKLVPQRIVSIQPVTEPTTVYNLQTDEPHTFFAAGLAVHNKGGGCFLGDTPVTRADGTTVAISEVRAGDQLLAFEPGGRIVTAAVQSVITHDAPGYLVVTTDSAVVRATPEHPFLTGDGTFRPLGELAPGDSVYSLDGGQLKPQRIVSIQAVAETATVYNLQADEPHTFFAAGLAVHNKGGGGGFGGGGGYHGGGYSGHSGGAGSSGGGAEPGDSWVIGFVVVLALLFLIPFVIWAAKSSRRNLDFVFAESAVKPKVQKTLKLLEFIARTDGTMVPAALEDVTRTTFTLLQKCWQASDYTPMKPLMMPDLYMMHCRQIQGMIASHEINVIEGLEIMRIQIVHVRYTDDANKREFTALVTAKARDYYVDDRTNNFLRGDTTPQPFQEFWTFHRLNNAWLLRQVEQSRESDALKEENFFEQFTDEQLRQVYGDAAGAGGKAGPWLNKAMQTKAARTERLLNFLVQTDKLWDRPKMLERARQVFTNIYVALEDRDEQAFRPEELFPDILARYQGIVRKWKQSDSKIEYRNLCVRTVELILVRNYNDNSKDDFTVRISSHAQRTVTKGGKPAWQDDDVTPFVEYWTFGRLDNQWKLKEVLPPAEGATDISLENVDEGSSSGQMEWFYNQTRAN